MFKKMSAFSRIMIFSFLVAAVVSAIGVTVTLVNNSVSNKQVSEEVALKISENLIPKIKIHEIPPRAGDISNLGNSVYDTLPDISKYPLLNQVGGEVVVEIMSSTEKATISSDSPNDAWLVYMAREFNETKPTINGKVGTIAVRGIASGVAKDYIVSGKHIPQALTLSNSLWTDDIASQGVPLELVSERIAGNVAGIALTSDAYKRLNGNHGEVTITTIINAAVNNEITFGYSNPLASSAGANLLLTILEMSEPNNMFGEQARAFFSKFQSNVDLVAYTTLQLSTSVAKGKLDAFVTEAQQLANTSDYDSFQFVPFGVRHDNPLYIVGNITDEQRELVLQFSDFIKSGEAQKRASQFGFNKYDDYSPKAGVIDGTKLTDAQALYKDKKSGSKKVVAVFVIDTSGSMDGAPMNSIQQALRHSVQYIGEECIIGMVSFADDVYIEMPLSEFNIEAMSNFVGAVDNLTASGGTSIYDGLAVASKMISDYKQQHGDVRPTIFLMSDGIRQGGLSYRDVEKMLIGFKVPINTISYNGDYPHLKDLSLLNEGAFIRADSDDVAYKLASFFNSEL